MTFATPGDAQLAAAAAATLTGHELGNWHRISGRMFGNMCLKCGALVFVERPAGVDGELWHLDLSGVEAECPFSE